MLAAAAGVLAAAAAAVAGSCCWRAGSSCCWHASCCCWRAGCCRWLDCCFCLPAGGCCWRAVCCRRAGALSTICCCWRGGVLSAAAGVGAFYLLLRAFYLLQLVCYLLQLACYGVGQPAGAAGVLSAIGWGAICHRLACYLPWAGAGPDHAVEELVQLEQLRLQVPHVHLPRRGVSTVPHVHLPR